MSKTPIPLTNSTQNETFQYFSDTYSPLFEDYLINILSTTYPDQRQLLADAISYSCINKGKRVRPLLAIASSLLFDRKPQVILPFASALEMIHTYSLIHDDLPAMDNDDFRRCQPTNHKKFGEDMAILSGDALLTYAFEIMSTNLTAQFFSEDILISIRYLSKECGQLGLIGGQVLDIKHQGSSNKEMLEHIHKLKTGALIKSAIVIPGLLHKANSTDISLLEQFGRKIGRIFQIVDDILDINQTTELL